MDSSVLELRQLAQFSKSSLSELGWGPTLSNSTYSYFFQSGEVSSDKVLNAVELIFLLDQTPHFPVVEVGLQVLIDHLWSVNLEVGKH